MKSLRESILDVDDTKLDSATDKIKEDDYLIKLENRYCSRGHDMLNQPIKEGDWVVWSNNPHSVSLVFAGIGVVCKLSGDYAVVKCCVDGDIRFQNMAMKGIVKVPDIDDLMRKFKYKSKKKNTPWG